MYISKSVYEKQSRMYENYVLMENILTSFEPSLSYVDFDGRLVFSRDMRSDKEKKSLKMIHDGVLDRLKDTLKFKKRGYIS